MAHETGDRIRELKIMIRQIDIETVHTCPWPYLTVLDHVSFILKPYWSYGDRLKTYVHARGVDFIYDCINGLIRSHTFSHGLVRLLINTIIHGHDIRTRLLKVKINHTRLSRIHLNGQSGSVVCTVYTVGKPCKPCVLCEIETKNGQLRSDIVNRTSIQS